MSEQIEWTVIQLSTVQPATRKARPKPKRRRGFKGKVGTPMVVKRRG